MTRWTNAARWVSWTIAALLQLALPASQVLGQSTESVQTPTDDTVAAPDTGELPPAYKAAAELGFKEFEFKNYPEAYARFLEADALYPNARMARALGMVEYELRHYEQAVQHLTEALARTARPLSAEERDAAEKLRTQAEGYLARYTILTKPEATKLTLDGTLLAPGPGHALTLQVGDHIVEARAKDYWPLRRELHVIGQLNQTIQLQLQPIPRDAIQGEPAPFYESPWLWTGVGVVVVGAVVLAILLSQPSDRIRVGAPITTENTPGNVILQALGSR
jgi:tetratricopeptide (TPR) repeat protein